MKGRSPIYFGAWTFLTVSAPHLFPATTTGFDHGPEVPTVETPGCYSLHFERGHRGHESRKGDLEHDTSQGHFWFRQCHPRHDQSVFPCPP
jgi:hypothetical protein